MQRWVQQLVYYKIQVSWCHCSSAGEDCVCPHLGHREGADKVLIFNFATILRAKNVLKS
jgi:hypothetical protein